MNQHLLREVGNNQRIAVLTQLKHSDGMSVRQLASALKMSYMGVKQHCLELERRGFVQSSPRSESGVGRPELVYCATKRAQELFTEESRDVGLLLLDATRALLDRWAELSPETLRKITRHAEAISKLIGGKPHSWGLHEALFERFSKRPVDKDRVSHDNPLVQAVD